MSIRCDNKSVGMLIWQDGKLLLIERRLFPFGFAPPAGHVDDKGGFESAAREEVQEEVGLRVIKMKLLTESRKDNKCRREGGSWHYWKIYEVEADGDLKPNQDEAKQVGWYGLEQIKELTNRTKDYLEKKISEEEWQSSPGIETVWFEWFSELKII